MDEPLASLAVALSGQSLVALLPLLRRAGTIGLILVLASVGYALAARLLSRALTPRPGAADVERKRRRAATLVPLGRSLARYLIYFVAGVAILQQLGIDATAILASAGVVGVAVGFGAQSLVRDLLSGMFLLFEGLIAVGDVIRVGEHAGEVESIGIRVTQIRKLDGELRVIPNGEITSFGHLKRGFSRAVVEVGLAYEQDVDWSLDALRRAVAGWAEEQAGVALEAPEVQGIVQFGASECLARVVAKVSPGEQWAAERSLRRAIRRAFDAEGVDIPLPRQVSYVRREERRPQRAPDGAAP